MIAIQIVYFFKIGNGLVGLVKKKCHTPLGKGICTSHSHCKTLSPKHKEKGSCKRQNEVCCFFERPDGVTDDNVKKAIASSAVSFNFQSFSFYKDLYRSN